MTEHADRLLTAADVAELLAVSQRYVLELARRNQIPHVRIGRAVRFRRESVVEWVEAREQGRHTWKPARSG